MVDRDILLKEVIVMLLRLIILSTAMSVVGLSAAQASAIPSYSCVFTEPFVSVDSFPGGLRYVTPEKVETLAATTFTIFGPATVLGGTLASGKGFSVKIIKQAASDGMSELMRPYAGTLSGTAVSLTVHGACLKFPDGTTPRPVKKVAANDKLNVRSKPNAKAKIINRVGPQGFVWAFPESAAKGWVRVATAVYPRGDSGTITISTGWVNAKFLGLPGDR